MHSFTFNGLNSREYCELFVSGGGTFNSPERDYESVPVPGRNGELTIDHGRFKNIQVEYVGSISKDFDQNAQKLRSWLSSGVGYFQLEDDYHPEEYRMARFKGPIEFNTINSTEAGGIKVSFDCMPQRFLKNGLNPIALSPNGEYEITNYTKFDALPHIRIFTRESSGGIVKIGVRNENEEMYHYITVKNARGGLTLNSDIMRAYNNGESRDADIFGSYPVLAPGVNHISIVSDPGLDPSIISSVVFYPRWWTL